MRMKLLCGALLLSGLASLGGLPANAGALPNASFEEGSGTAPSGWVPGGSGKTTWENVGHSGRRSVSVSSSQEGESLFWACKNLKFKPGQPYRFSFWSKDENSSEGCIISGLNDASHDYPFKGKDWVKHSFVFVAPHQEHELYLRVGQWSGKGKAYFDDVELEELTPVYTKAQGLVLGSNESIFKNTYSFDSRLGDTGFSRVLQSTSASFNSTRWSVAGDAAIVYRHIVGDFQQKNATVMASIGYYRGGELVLEASNDNKSWVKVASGSGSGSVRGAIPASLFPAREIYVRMRAADAHAERGDSSPGAFQIINYRYAAGLNGKAPNLSGRTHFMTTQQAAPSVRVQVNSLGAMLPGVTNALELQLSSQQKLGPAKATLTLKPEADSNAKPLVFTTDVKGGQEQEALKIPYRFTQTGAWTAKIEVTQGQKTSYSATVDFPVSILHAIDYGSRIAGSGDLWWSESTYKVHKSRPMPPATAQSKAVTLKLARNEYEAVQIIARPQRDIAGVTVKASALAGPGNARIAAENITIKQVEYVNVQHISDSTGTVGEWPDPLPPLTKPIGLKANINQPFWITVFAPKGAAAGTYKGTVHFKGQGWQRDVPLQITVWDFTLPDEGHIKSAFGLAGNFVEAYHHISKNELPQMLEKYKANYARHRLAPYLYEDDRQGIKVDWGLSSFWQGAAYDANNTFAGKQSLTIEDTSENAAAEATLIKQLPIVNGRRYDVKFALRTRLNNQKVQLTLNTYDANGKWIPGNNQNFAIDGTTEWREILIDVTQQLSNPLVRAVTISLRPTPWTAAGEGTGAAWFDNLQVIEDGKTDLLQGQGDFEPAGTHVTADQVKIDFSDFDVATAKNVNEHHFTTIRLHLEGSGSGSGDSYSPGVIGPYAQGTEEYNILFGSYLKQLQVHLEEKGWIDEAYLYWYDEPTPAVYERIREMGDLIHRYAPKLKWMLTQDQPDKRLYQTVDIWCPELDMYDHKVATELQAQGREIWWYICTSPRAPFVGDFIDHAAIEPRLWLWQSWQNKVQGVLIWGTNYWTSSAAYPTFPDVLQNPWEDPMSWNHTNALMWGNSDGRFLYPPNRRPNEDRAPNLDGPIDSTRWDLLRDGMEDYEYFWMLQQSLNCLQQRGARTAAEKAWQIKAKNLLQVPATISTSLTQFSKDPQPLLKQRARIAQAIVEGADFGK